MGKISFAWEKVDNHKSVVVVICCLGENLMGQTKKSFAEPSRLVKSCGQEKKVDDQFSNLMNGWLVYQGSFLVIYG